jgi:tRNA pseudouridine55 synthase
LAEQVFGFLNIDKPQGITSHDVVASVRRLSRSSTATKKVGHAGTLDPLATGVLILCLGHATRLSEYAMQSTKQYCATIHLGIETDTYDAEGEIVSQTDASHITKEQLEAAFLPFIGDIQQVPPIYSAIKKDGKKLYELARQGQEIELESRSVHIYNITLQARNPPHVVLDITCAAGTYIRSLAHDIGEKLAVGAHLSALIRTRSGGFKLENAVALDALLENDNWQQHIIAPKDALSDWQTCLLNEEQITEIRQGRMIENDSSLSNDYIMAYMADGHLLAVLENRGKHWKPHKVFLPQS